MDIDERDDDVDLLIDRWAELLPDADLTPLDVMSRLRRAALRLDDLRTDAFASASLSTWEFDVLAALRRSTRPLSPSQLIRATNVGSGATTHRLDRLVERGFVRRRANPADGRGFLIVITEMGEERVDAAMRELLRLEAAALDGLEPSARALLARLLATLAPTGPTVDR